MKNIFDTDKQTNLKDGECFKVQTLEGDIVPEKEKAEEVFTAYGKKVFKPVKSLIISTLVLINVAMAACVAVAIAINDKDKRSAIIFLIIIIATVIMVLLSFSARRKSEDIVNSSEFVAESEKFENVVNIALSALSVPQDAESIDILSYAYDIKNGKRHISIFKKYYSNDEMIIFCENENLCFADAGGNCKYAVPIAEIKSIVRKKKYAVMSNWNKDTPYSKEPYKKYKVRYNNGYYSVKPHYSVRVEHDGEDYEFIVPSYDIEILQKYVNLPISDQKR